MVLRQLVEEFDDVEIVVPVHKNPKVREVVNEELGVLRPHLVGKPIGDGCMSLVHEEVVNILGGLPSIKLPQIFLTSRTRFVL